MRTVFLDRDGVLNRKRPEGQYVTRWEEFEFLPRAAEGLHLLQEAGLRLIVVTNQRGVALGRLSEADLEAIHRRMAGELAQAGVRLAAVYHCPHDRGRCDCRKPGTGLFLRAQADFPDTDFGQSAVVGDSLSDLEAAARLDCPGYLVAEGQRREEVLGEARRQGIPVQASAPSLYDLVEKKLLLAPVCKQNTSIPCCRLVKW
jgi:D-glycero-D-manno-heptose 1,7-bisphosphate phosphatase